MTSSTYSIQEASYILAQTLQDGLAKLLWPVNVALGGLCVLLSVTLLSYVTFGSLRGVGYADAVMRLIGLPVFDRDMKTDFAFAGYRFSIPRSAVIRLQSSFSKQENELVFALNWQEKDSSQPPVLFRSDYVIVLVSPYSSSNTIEHIQNIIIQDMNQEEGKTQEGGARILPSKSTKAAYYYLARGQNTITALKCQRLFVLQRHQCTGAFVYEDNLLIRYRLSASNLPQLAAIEAAISQRLDAFIQ